MADKGGSRRAYEGGRRDGCVATREAAVGVNTFSSAAPHITLFASCVQGHPLSPV